MYIIIFFAQLPMFLSAENTFRAAVFEVTISSKTPMGNVSRDNAIDQMENVLKGYNDVATKASKEVCKCLTENILQLLSFDMNQILIYFDN